MKSNPCGGHWWFKHSDSETTCGLSLAWAITIHLGREGAPASGPTKLKMRSIERFLTVLKKSQAGAELISGLLEHHETRSKNTLAV